MMLEPECGSLQVGSITTHCVWRRRGLKFPGISKCRVVVAAGVTSRMNLLVKEQCEIWPAPWWCVIRPRRFRWHRGSSEPGGPVTDVKRVDRSGWTNRRIRVVVEKGKLL